MIEPRSIQHACVVGAESSTYRVMIGSESGHDRAKIGPRGVTAFTRRGRRYHWNREGFPSGSEGFLAVGWLLRYRKACRFRRAARAGSR
jgi:hypothetical protein